MNQRSHELNPSTPERFFLLQPIFAMLLALLVTIGGFAAYFNLVKESLPDLAIPQATIIAQWPGADPQTMEQEVTEAIEKEIKTLKNLKSVSSASFDSFSIIAVEFRAEADLDQSMQLLRLKVDDAEAELPAEVETPEINQVSVDDRPILTVVLYGNLDEALLGSAATEIEDRLERVHGVNEVEIGGARDEVIRVDLLPGRLRALRVSPLTVRDQIRAANVDMPWGEIESEQFGATTRLYGRFRDIEDLKRLPIVRTEGGRVVRLEEIARVRRDLEKETARAFFSWEGSRFRRSVEISVKKVPGSDTLQVIRNVKAEFHDLAGSRVWPFGLDYRITQDQSEQIWESLSNVLVNGLQAMIGVFVVLFLLMSWREGLMAGLSIPLSFLGALILVWALGYTLNELVIIGMVLALGLLVDVFILMMEGMHEGIYVQRSTFETSAIQTFRRYALPAAVGQATTILALAPLMAISGVAGKFIRVLPVTAIACLVVAFLVALLVDIPLSRFLLKPRRSEGKDLLADRVTSRLSEALREWSLRSSLKNRWISLLWVGGAFAVLLAAILAFTTVPIVMYPESDGRKLGITIELSPSTTLDSSQELADRVGEILRSKPYLESVVKLVGKKSPLAQSSLSDALKPSEAEYLVGFSCIFVRRADRDKPGYEYADELRDELRTLLDHHYAAASLIVVPETGSPSTEDPIQIELTGDDIDQLRHISRDVQSELSKVLGTTDVRDNLGRLRTEIKLLPRREALDFYGLSEQQVASQILYAMNPSEVGKFVIGNLQDDLSLRLGTAWPSRQGREGGPTRMDELAMIRVFRDNGDTLAILSVMEPRFDSTPISITHKNARRSVVVLGKTANRPAGEIVGEMRPILDRLAGEWPAGYSYDFGGEAQEVSETFGSAGIMLVLAIALVFSLLVLVFGSFSQSFIVISMIPLAMVGVFAGFGLFRIPFSFFAMVGTISLIGIVVNDAIVMVDTMNRHLNQGLAVDKAAAGGAADRLRPIVSTTATTIIGLIPLAISNPMWRPLCFAIIFGLLAATVISLVIVPCLYYLFTRESATSPSHMAGWR